MRCCVVQSANETTAELFPKVLINFVGAFSSQSLIFKMNRNRQKYLENRNLRIFEAPLARIGSARISGQGAFSQSPGWQILLSRRRQGAQWFLCKVLPFLLHLRRPGTL